MKTIKELRTDYVDEDNLRHLDAYFTKNDNENGKTVAVVDQDSGKVIFFDNAFVNEPLVIENLEAIKLALAQKVIGATIEYNWWNNDLYMPTEDNMEMLHTNGQSRIRNMIMQGVREGELHEDVQKGKESIQFFGWWSVKYTGKPNSQTEKP